MRISFSFFYLYEDINEASSRFAGYQLEEGRATETATANDAGAGDFDGRVRLQADVVIPPFGKRHLPAGLRRLFRLCCAGTKKAGSASHPLLKFEMGSVRITHRLLHLWPRRL